MRIRLEIMAISVFLVGSVSLLAWFSISKPRILVLQSYDKDYSWVKDVNTGLKRVLDPRRDFSVRWHYLDTKRHPTPEFKANASKIARRMIDEAPPDVIIAVDDDAQQYVARYYLDHPTIKIVFAGVNNEPEAYGFERAGNVTGILERLPLAALKETLLIAAQRNRIKSPLRIQFIGDRSETVLGDEKFFRNYDWAPLQVKDSALVKTYPEWQQAVLESAGKVDFLINSNYRKVMRSATDPSLVPASELIAWTESHSPVPFIGANGFFAEDGGMLAIGTSPYEQGEIAAKLATQILDRGIPPKQLPFLITRQFVVAMRGAAIRNRHFDMPQVYEAAARAGNKYIE
ncbi:MAG: ABC transporter substrate binding protein [Sulfuricellaceae bacterium]